MDASKLLGESVAIARAAGREILEVYAGNFAVEAKEDDSPLTAADLAAHRLIVDRLRALTPDVPVFSEESAGITYETRAGWRRYWLVDPLDGTREFIKRNGEFTVNIALVESGVPVLGVVHAPVGDITWYAAKGAGAYRQDGDAAAKPVRARVPAADPPVIAASRSHAGGSLAPFLERIGGHRLVSAGSSLKFCLVAEGSADCYPRLGPTSEWDTAAAHCVAEVAGCSVTDLEGKPLRYNRKASLINPHFVVYADPGYGWRRFVDPGR